LNNYNQASFSPKNSHIKNMRVPAKVTKFSILTPKIKWLNNSYYRNKKCDAPKFQKWSLYLKNEKIGCDPPRLGSNQLIALCWPHSRGNAHSADQENYLAQGYRRIGLSKKVFYCFGAGNV